MERTLIADAPSRIGQRLRVAGWISSRRDHGKLVFIDLRDASGVVQIVFRPDDAPLHATAETLRDEWVIAVEGVIRARPSGMEHPDLPTGGVELAADALEVLSQSKTTPFQINGDGYEVNEELRLRYRYLDLRRMRLARTIRLRSRFVEAAREYLLGRGFVEIETPLLTKSTPEGSRDFVVPSRLQPGTFYALPQSPQQYKQLLMVAGFERYFQIARCLRDEDLRADRGFEHSQIDLEMSFVEQGDVMRMAEGLIIQACEAVGASLKEKPFPVFDYSEAMKKFGADKFDLRTPEEQGRGVLAFAWVKDFPLFEKTDAGGWTYGHNPFTAPRPEDEAALMRGEDIGALRSLQYDLVCNGAEVGGGGIRIHRREVLERVFALLGHDRAGIERQFGHMLEAFEFGTPPHGGIALGIERLIMTLTGEESLREVQAFPMTSGGRTAVMDAPAELSEAQLRELGITIRRRQE